MTKIHKAINLDKAVYEDIRKRSQDGFNFSGWVEKEYENQFMQVRKWQEQINAAEQVIQKAREELSRIDTAVESYRAKISSSERKFLISVLGKIDEGKTWKGLLFVFNRDFGKDWDIYTFKKTVMFLAGK